MLSQLPAILKCLYCGCNGLNLAPDTKTYTFRTGDQEIEVVERGAVLCRKCQTSYPVEDGILNMLPHTLKGLNQAQLSGQWKLTAWAYERPWRLKALTWLAQRDWPPSEEIETLIQMLSDTPPPKMTIHNNLAFYLDLACSTCFYGRNMALALKDGRLDTGTATGTVVSLDNSWAMLQQARKFIQTAGVTGYISLIRADVENLPFINEAFVGIGGGAILNEFQDPDKALQEAARVLAPDANFVCMNQVAASSGWGRAIQKFLSLSSGLNFFEKDQLPQMFQEARLKLKAQQASGLITLNQLVPQNSQAVS